MLKLLLICGAAAGNIVRNADVVGDETFIKFMGPESSRIIAGQSYDDVGDMAYYEENPKSDKVSLIMCGFD